MKKAKNQKPTSTRKPNPYTKRNLIQARLDNDELNIVHPKAVVYCGGNMSEFVRLAVLNYKPLKKGPPK